MRNKEWVLNIAFNRWQFNRPKYVGKLAEAIHRCAPKSVEEWKRCYFKCVRPTGQMLGKDMQEHLREVGRRLYVKVSEHLKAEVEAVTEKDCVEYVREMDAKVPQVLSARARRKSVYHLLGNQERLQEANLERGNRRTDLC